MNIPGIEGRQRRVNEIETFVAKKNSKGAHILIFLMVDWFDMSVVMHYKACCGHKIEQKFYKKTELQIKTINPQFNVRWKYRK